MPTKRAMETLSISLAGTSPATSTGVANFRKKLSIRARLGAESPKMSGEMRKVVTPTPTMVKPETV